MGFVTVGTISTNLMEKILEKSDDKPSGSVECSTGLEKLDAGKRNGVESFYGVTKWKYGLGLIKSKLEETSKAEIILQFLVMNLERRLQVLCAYFKMSIC